MTAKRTALVTGGGGLGRAIALALRDAGHDVIVTYHASEDATRAWVDEEAAKGRRVALYQVDVGDYASCQALMGRLERDGRQIDLAAVFGALAHRVVAFVGGQFRQPGLGAQGLPEVRRVGRDVQIAIARGMNAGDAARPHVSPNAARFALGPDQPGRLQGQRAAQQRHAHELATPAAFAFIQR